MGLSSRRSEWAATTPWSGVQDKPAWADDPDHLLIPIDDVIGLRQALDARALKSSLAKVAFSGDYNDLNHLPHFGTAAFADISDFQSAPRANTYQIGYVDLVAGTQSYTVAFTTTMLAIPKIDLQHFMVDDNGEIFFASVALDSVTTTGFKFWLNGVPSVSSGKVQYRAFIQDQP